MNASIGLGVCASMDVIGDGNNSKEPHYGHHDHYLYQREASSSRRVDFHNLITRFLWSEHFSGQIIMYDSGFVHSVLPAETTLNEAALPMPTILGIGFVSYLVALIGLLNLFDLEEARHYRKMKRGLGKPKPSFSMNRI
jgi:hypothetical protein